MNLTGWSTGPRDTVIDVLERSVANDPDRVCFEFPTDNTSLTPRGIWTQAANLATCLAECGASAQQPVLTMLDTNSDAVLAWFSINWLNAISAPINTALKGAFLRHQCDDTGAVVAICEAHYLNRFLAISEKLDRLETIIVRGAFEQPEACPYNLLAWDEALNAKRGPAVPMSRPSWRDISMIIYTGGTTGPSKGCMISHNYACNLARQSHEVTLLGPDDTLLTPLPLFHFNATATGVLVALLVGAKTVFLPRFSVSNFWPDVEASGATVVSVLSSMVPLLAFAEDNDAMLRCRGQVRAVAGGPFTPEVEEIWRTRFGVAYTGANFYGMTECCLITSLPHKARAAPGSSGKRNEYFDVRIVDDEDMELPPGSAGEIICRPKQPHIMFEGYWNRPADTMKVMKNLWMHTGDIGKFDQDGFFYFVDRKKDYLRRGAENISSFEMEAAFIEHEDIEEVAVHAVFSELSEDELKVTAVLRNGSRLSEEQLCRWCIDRVPYYAVPRFIEFRQELPKSPLGRVLKYQLRDEGRTPQTWDRTEAGVKFERK